MRACRELGRLLRVSQLNATPAAYGPVLDLQQLLWAQRKAGLIADTLLQLQVRRANGGSKLGEDQGCCTPACTAAAAPRRERLPRRSCSTARCTP